MENQKEGQEIDLVSVLSVCVKQVKKFFASIGRGFVWCLRYAYKNKKYMLAALLCAIGFTAYWARPAHRGYQMECEIRIHVLDAYFFKDLVSNLNYMCLNNDRKSLKNALGIDEEVANKMSSVDSYYIVDKLCDGTPDEVCYGKYVADTTKVIMKDRLMIGLVVSDTSLVDSIKNGLVRYFDKNPYVCQNNHERVSQIEGQIASIDKEVLMLDSLRKYEYFVKAAKEMKLNGPLIVSEKSKELYYNDILSLEKARNEKMFEKAVFSKSVSFVRDFVLIKVQNKYIPTFILSLIVFGGLFFLLALFVGEKSRIKSFLEE